MRQALLLLSLALAATASHAQSMLIMEHIMLGMPRAQVQDRLPSLTCKGDRCHAVMAMTCGFVPAGPQRDACVKPYLVAGVEPTMWALEFMDGRLASVYVTVPARQFIKVADALIARFGPPTEQPKDPENRRMAWQEGNALFVAIERSGGSDISSFSLSTKAHAERQRKRDRPG